MSDNRELAETLSTPSALALKQFLQADKSPLEIALDQIKERDLQAISPQLLSSHARAELALIRRWRADCPEMVMQR